MNNEEAHRDSCDHRLLGPVCRCVAAARHKGGNDPPQYQLAPQLPQKRMLRQRQKRKMRKRRGQSRTRSLAPFLSPHRQSRCLRSKRRSRSLRLPHRSRP